MSFVGIDQAWLRQAAKRWAQQWLATGFAFNTVQAAALTFKPSPASSPWSLAITSRTRAAVVDIYRLLRTHLALAV